MSKENKIILFVQIIVSIIGILFFINLPEQLELINNTTGKPLDAISSLVVFNFIFFIFGSWWYASLFVCVVETYLFIRDFIRNFLLKIPSTSIIDEEVFECQMKWSIFIGYISTLIVLLVKLQT